MCVLTKLTKISSDVLTQSEDYRTEDNIKKTERSKGVKELCGGLIRGRNRVENALKGMGLTPSDFACTVGYKYSYLGENLIEPNIFICVYADISNSEIARTFVKNLNKTNFRTNLAHEEIFDSIDSIKFIYSEGYILLFVDGAFNENKEYIEWLKGTVLNFLNNIQLENNETTCKELVKCKTYISYGGLFFNNSLRD